MTQQRSGSSRVPQPWRTATPHASHLTPPPCHTVQTGQQGRVWLQARLTIEPIQTMLRKVMSTAVITTGSTRLS